MLFPQALEGGPLKDRLQQGPVPRAPFSQRDEQRHRAPGLRDGVRDLDERRRLSRSGRRDDGIFLKVSSASARSETWKARSLSRAGTIPSCA